MATNTPYPPFASEAYGTMEGYAIVNHNGRIVKIEHAGGISTFETRPWRQRWFRAQYPDLYPTHYFINFSIKWKRSRLMQFNKSYKANLHHSFTEPEWHMGSILFTGAPAPVDYEAIQAELRKIKMPADHEMVHYSF